MSIPKLLPRHALPDLLDECMQHDNRRGRKERLLIGLMGLAGLRSIEARHLRRVDVSEDHDGTTWLHLRIVKRTVRQGDSKRGRARRVPATPELAAYLWEWIESDYRGGVYLVDSHAGNPLNRKTVYRIVERVALDAGYPGVHPHMLRHTCLSEWVHRGIPLHDVAALSGHANLTQLQVYLHSRPEDLAALVRGV